jgi:hypothetical protein
MSNLIGTYDHTTGENTTREMTEEEIAAFEEQKAETLARKEEADKKELARASALSKLIDLGLTEEEIAAL